MTFFGIAVSAPPISIRADAIALPYSAIQVSKASNASNVSNVSEASVHAARMPRAATGFRYTRSERTSGKRAILTGGGSAARNRRDTLPRWNAAEVLPADSFDSFSPLPRMTDAPRRIAADPAAILAAASASTWQRAQNLFAETYAGVHACTPAQAREVLREADSELYDRWRDIGMIEQTAWRPVGPDAPRGPHGLAHAAATFSQYLRAHPQLDDQTARNVARTYLVHPPVTTVEGDVLSAVYRDVLRRRLDWIDIGKVHARGLSAEQILKTVCRLRQGALDRAELDRRLRNYRDVMIDESALIAFYAWADGDAGADDMPIAAVRAQFITALIDEWQDSGLGALLMPSAAIAPDRATFWYDGMVLRNARGKNLTGIADALYAAGAPAPETPSMQRRIRHANRARRLFGQPGDAISAAQRHDLLRDMHGDIAAGPRYAMRAGAVQVGGDIWLTRGEMQGVIEKTMRGLALDTVHAAGTPLNAIATTLHRQGPAHDIHAGRFDNVAELMQAFNRLNHAWRQHPRFPVQPWLAAAYLLAENSGVLLSEADGADAAADADGAATAGAPERIRYRGAADLQRQLRDYFKERLLAHAPLPQYDEDFLIRRILRSKLGMTDADLQRGNGAGMRRIRYGLSAGGMSALDEFKARADQPLVPAAMQYHGKTIDAAAERRAMRKRAADALLESPVLAAKSKEMLRLRDKAHTAADAREIHRLLVDNIMGLQQPQPQRAGDFLSVLDRLFGSATLAGIVDALASGNPREIIGLFPFVVPLYDIEEGIRLGDKERAWDGALHFGEDAILTILGGAAEGVLRKQLARDAESLLFAQSRMSAAERAGAGTMQRMRALMPEAAADRLAQRRVAIDEDAFDVHAAPPSSATIPKTVEALATPACAPDNGPYRMVYLDGEQARVPAVGSGSAHVFVETDLRGAPLPQAPPILYDPVAARYFRLTRKYGLRRIIGTLAYTDMMVRRTVFDTLKYWRPVLKLRDLDHAGFVPEAAVRTVFEPNSHPLAREFEQFWITACRRSETAAAIMQRVQQEVIAGRAPCRVEFGADVPRAESDSIWFIAEDALTRLHYISPHGPEPFQRSRMWLHESLHWLTGTSDPRLVESTGNRGATIYLTDRILSELGDDPPLAPRTAYAQPHALAANAESGAIGDAWRKRLRQVNDWSVAENVFLDSRLDERRVFPSAMQLFGQPVAQRITVRQILALEGHFSTLGKLAAGNHAHIFDLTADAFAAPPSLHLRSKLRTLVMGSDAFRKMAAAWNAKPRTAAVYVTPRDFEAHHALYDDRNPEAFHATQDRRQIVLNTRELHYFSEHGLAPLGPMRQLAGAMVDLFLQDMITAAYQLPMPNRFFNRGAGVLLENLILRQIGDPSPQRICEALTGDADAYLGSQTTITRAAISEDGYLERKLREGLQGDTAIGALPAGDDAGRCLSFICL